MRTKKVSRHFCEFCNKGKFSKPWMIRHERHCYRNPGREPYEGELTFCGQTGKMVNFGNSDALPSGMSWLEWVETDPEEMPKWWPGKPGMIYHEGKWYDVPGHQIDYPKGAHGCAGGPAPFDVWPKVYSGQTLETVGAAQRWEAIEKAIRFEQHLDQASETVAAWPEWKQNLLGR